MKHHKKSLTFLIALAFVMLCLGALPSAAAAKRTLPPGRTQIEITSLEPVKLGEPVTIKARLQDSRGKPLSDRAVSFYIDLNYIGQARTDSFGLITHRSIREITAGEHLVTVRYAGAIDYSSSIRTTKLRVRPSLVQVQTVPPLAGITFSMDGREFVTGEDGLAETNVYKMGSHTLRAEVEKFKSEDTRIEFGRWEMEVFQPEREVDVPTKAPIQAGINVFHRIGQTFVDLDGGPIETKRISKITIRSIHGDVFTFNDGGMRWVPASRVARRPNGLEVTPLQYSVMNVTVDGSNVVNQAQQRFFVKPEEVFKIQLLLYSMRIGSHDALFGSPVGTHVQVEYPNGAVRVYPLDSTGKADILSLARGIYRIQVMGVSGMISPTPVALSRDQEVDIKVLTNVDLGMAGVAGLIIAIGLLLVGRPWLLHRIVRNKNHSDPDLERQAEGYVTYHNN